MIIEPVIIIGYYVLFSACSIKIAYWFSKQNDIIKPEEVELLSNQ